jgi:UDP-N-acetylmuramoyl-tripeptide--D-alanyl-D-alanine ligase
VAHLAEAVGPDVSVIVSVGREHLEKLGSLERVAREEASQLEFLRPGGLAVINADAPFLADVVWARGGGGGAGTARPFNVVTFGTRRDADLRVAVARQDDEGLEFTINGRQRFRVPMLGRHNAVNAAAAVAVGRRFGLEYEAIARALATVRGPEMRLDPMIAGGVRVINDAYNANPDSMAAALATFAELARGPGRRILVLGDMLELGGHADAAHAEAVRSALDPGTGADLVVLVGPLMARASRAVRDARLRRVEDPSDARVSGVAALLAPGDVVLLKGSRRMRLERVAAALESRRPRAASA